jgi:hypothetical protein
LKVAVIVTLLLAATGQLVTLNDAVVWPARMTTLAGTEAAAGLLEERAIVVSAAAGTLSVTVPFAPTPPVTVVGDTVVARMETLAMVSKFRPSYANVAAPEETSALRGEYVYEVEPTVISFPTASYVTALGVPFCVIDVSFGVVPESEALVLFQVPSDEESMFPMASYAYVPAPHSDVPVFALVSRLMSS